MDIMSFLLGVSTTFIVLIAIAELSSSKRAKEPVGRAEQCISTYNSTGNTDFLREARKQLDIAVWREEHKKPDKDRHPSQEHEKL